MGHCGRQWSEQHTRQRCRKTKKDDLESVVYDIKRDCLGKGSEENSTKCLVMV